MSHLVRYARWYWIAWVVLAFLPPELYAVFNKTQGDTFSENWWALFGILNHVPVWWHVAGVLVTIVTGVWLTGHLAFGWWGGPNKSPVEEVTSELTRIHRMVQVDPGRAREMLAELIHTGKIKQPDIPDGDV